jgi:DNA-binding CsgD family transcriptional regulator
VERGLSALRENGEKEEKRKMRRGILTTIVTQVFKWLKKWQIRNERRLEERLRRSVWLGMRLEEMLDIWTYIEPDVNFVLIPTVNEPRLSTSEIRAEYIKSVRNSAVNIQNGGSNIDLQLPAIRNLNDIPGVSGVNSRVMDLAKLDLVAFWLKEGMTKTEIAKRLCVSRATINRYLKLGQRLM